MAKLGSPRALVVATGLGVVFGALLVAGLHAVGDGTSDGEIVNEVLGAGEVVTWEAEQGEVCMRWGERFQACDYLSEGPPPPIDPPPTPLALPEERPPPDDRFTSPDALGG
jgi:hypothetical protein